MTGLSETERAPQQVDLSQGDILRVEWPDGSNGPSLGVILNADCDLSHDRTDGAIAIVPIYPFDDYLARFWAAGHVEEVMSTATNAVLELAEDSDGEGLHQWVRLVGPIEVAKALSERKALKPGPRQKLEHSLERLAICLDRDGSAIDRFKNLCRAAPNPTAYARTQLNSAKKAMGDGHFFISDLVDYPSVGFVVRMRRIYTLPEQDVFTSTSAQRSRSSGDGPSAVRVARLTSLYRFKVIQLFAQQYARIGLPDELSALSALAIEDLVASYTGA